MQYPFLSVINQRISTHVRGHIARQVFVSSSARSGIAAFIIALIALVSATTPFTAIGQSPDRALRHPALPENQVVRNAISLQSAASEDFNQVRALRQKDQALPWICQISDSAAPPVHRAVFQARSQAIQSWSGIPMSGSFLDWSGVVNRARVKAEAELLDVRERVLNRLAGGVQQEIRTQRVTQGLLHAFSVSASTAEGRSRLGFYLSAQGQGLLREPDLHCEPGYKIQALLEDSVAAIGGERVRSLLVSTGTLDGTGTRIGIIDTGVDYTRPDLGGCIGSTCKVAGGYDFVNRDIDPRDDQGHGTHVAATAAGAGYAIDNQGAIHYLNGVAPGAKIFAYKVLDELGSTSDLMTIVQALERCADPNGDGDSSDHLDVCNMSIGGAGGNPDDVLAQAVDRTSAAGVAVVVAAGNSGLEGPESINTPGLARQAITVGASCLQRNQASGNTYCQAGPIAGFSSRGPVRWNGEVINKPDVVAPGVDICAAEYGTWHQEKNCVDRHHIAISGTSMATPHVTGAVALLKGVSPRLSTIEIKDLLARTSIPFADPRVGRNDQGVGLIQIDSVLAQLGYQTQNLSSVSDATGGAPTLSEVFRPTAANQRELRGWELKAAGASALEGTWTFAGDPGLSVDVQPSSVSLGAAQTQPITVGWNLNFAQIGAKRSLGGLLSLVAPNGSVLARVPLRSEILERYDISKEDLDFDLDPGNRSTWTGTQQFKIANRMQDQSARITFSVEWKEFPRNAPPSVRQNTNPVFTVNANPLVLPGGATQLIDITANASNAALPNGRYRANLKIMGDDGFQTVLPLTFYKGYAVNIARQSKAPDIMIIHTAGNEELAFWKEDWLGNQKKIYVDAPGPWYAQALYTLPLGNTSTVQGAHVVAGPEPADTGGVATLDVSASRAIHRVTFHPRDYLNRPVYFNPQVNVGTTNTEVRVVHSPSGHYLNSGWLFGWDRQTPGEFVSTLVSDLSSEYTFVSTSAVGAQNNIPLHLWLYRWPGGIYQDLVLENQATDLAQKNVVTYPNSAWDMTYVFPSVAYNALDYEGSSPRVMTFTRYYPGASFRAKPEVPQAIYTYGLNPVATSASVPSKLQRIDYAQLVLNVTNTDPVYDPLGVGNIVTSPAYVDFGRPSAAMRPLKIWSAQPLSGEADWVQGPRGEDPSRLTLGAGPVIDATMWVNHGNISNFLNARHFNGVSYPTFQMSGGVHEGWLYSSTPLFTAARALYRLAFPDGKVFSDTLDPWRSSGAGNVISPPLGLPAPTGAYEWSLSRSYSVEGQSLEFKSISRFRLKKFAAPKQIHSNPPVIDYLSIMNQSQVLNRLAIGKSAQVVFAARALQGDGPIPNQLSNVVVRYQSGQSTSWTTLTTTQVLGEYTASLPAENIAGRPRVQVQLDDTAGNTLLSEWQLLAK